MTTETFYMAWQDRESRLIGPIGRLTRSGTQYESAHIQAARLFLAHGVRHVLGAEDLRSMR